MGFRVGLEGFRFGEFMKRKLRDSLSLLLPPSRRHSLSLLLSPPLLLSPTLTLAPSLIHVAGHIPCCCATARRPLENARGPPSTRQSVGGGKSIQKRVRTRFPLLKTTALRAKRLLATPSKTLAWSSLAHAHLVHLVPRVGVLPRALPARNRQR